jgi:hypothetical protein
MQRLAVVVILGALASGCGVATRAQAPVERPTLEVPPAPPRVIDPAPLPEVVQVEPTIEFLPPAPVEPKARPRAQRDTASSRETQKPEQKPETPAVDPAAPSVPAQSTPPVQRPQANADAAAAGRIREMIQRTTATLNNVDYQKLSDQRRGAYKDAQNHIAGAEIALKESNFELAQEMAEKAEKLANALQGR